ALFDLERGRVQVAADLRLALEFDGLLGVDVAGDPTARDDHRPGVDLGLHVGALADDQRILRVDLAGEGALDADRYFEGELALELPSPTEEGGELCGAVHLFPTLHPDLSRPRGHDVEQAIELLVAEELDLDLPPPLATIQKSNLRSQPPLEALLDGAHLGGVGTLPGVGSALRRLARFQPP